MTEAERNEKLSTCKRMFCEMRKQAGERWAISAVEGTAEDREWKNESKRIIVRNKSSVNAGQILPWPEILVFECDGQKSCYKMTRSAWVMIGLVEGYDRLSYEAKEGKIIVTVWKNRMAISTRGSRKKRKMLKNEAIYMIERQLSIYYDVMATLRFRRREKAYIVCLEDVVHNENHP